MSVPDQRDATSHVWYMRPVFFVTDIPRSIGFYVAVGRLRDRIAEPLALIGTTDASAALADQARTLDQELDSLRVRIQRAGPGRAAAGIENNAGPPTADVLWALDRAWSDVPSLVRELNGYIEQRLPALYRAWTRRASGRTRALRSGFRPGSEADGAARFRWRREGGGRAGRPRGGRPCRFVISPTRRSRASCVRRPSCRNVRRCWEAGEREA